MTRLVTHPLALALLAIDLKTLEFHLLDAGHFALESNGDEIADLMRDFLGRHLTTK